MSCNVVSNSGFEAGLAPWTVAAGSVANVLADPIAFSGANLLDITTTIATPSGTVSQALTGLDTTKPYNLLLRVRLRDPIASARSCTVSTHLGDDAEAGAIASDLIWNAGDWLLLNGTITPSVADTTLNLMGLCNFGEGITEAHLLWDQVTFSDC